MFHNSLRRILTTVVVAAMASIVLTPVAVADPSPEPPSNEVTEATSLEILNPGFELPLANDGSIPGWSIWGQQYPQTSYAVTDDLSHSGSSSLRIDDKNTERGIGIESDAVPVESGQSYMAKAMISIERSRASISVRYYDQNEELLHSEATILSSTDGEWTEISATLEAPVGTRTATVLFNSSTVDTGLAALDDVELTAVNDEPPPDTGPPSPEEVEAMDPRIDHIGAPVTSSRTWNTLLAEENGRSVVYGVYAGVGSSVSPAAFVVADAETGEIIRSVPVPGASGTVEVELATDGRAYFGTSSDFNLWRYDPATHEVEKIGPLNPADPSSSQIWALAAAENGTMYVGTYPEGTLYRYDPANGGHIENLGVVDETQQYIRALEYDHKRGALFAGVGGSRAQVYRIDVATGERQPLLTEESAPGAQDEQFISSFNFDGDRLFARSGSNQLLVLTAEGEVEYWTGVDRERFGYLVEPRPDAPGKFIFALNTYWEYDSTTGTTRDLGIPIDGVLSDAQWVERDDPDWPGWTMVASTGSGVQTVNFETERTEFVTIEYSNPAEVQKILTGPESLYASGYTSGLARFDSVTAEIGDTYDGGQYESSAVRDGKLILGAYGDGRVLEYDPATGAAPSQIFSLEDEGQDRPFGMSYDEEGDRLFVGTVAKYGSNQGALTQYDFATGERTVYTDQIVAEQSVVSVLYHEGLVYVGTTLDGGLAAPPSDQTSGHFIVFDPDTGEVAQDIIPVEGDEGVTGLLFGPDGLIWGVSEDTVFKYDPATEEIVFSEPLLGDRYGTNTVWAFAYLVVGADGAVYGTNRYQFFRIDAETMEYTQILDGVGNYANVDENGDIVFANGINVYKYSVPRDGEPPTCDETVTGQVNGRVSVDAESVLCLDGATVNGGVNVSEGGTLIASDSRLNGGVHTVNAAAVELRDSEVRGLVRVNDTSGNVIIAGNEIRGGLTCSDNATEPTNEGESNQVTGRQSGQCANL